LRSEFENRKGKLRRNALRVVPQKLGIVTIDQDSIVKNRARRMRNTGGKFDFGNRGNRCRSATAAYTAAVIGYRIRRVTHYPISGIQYPTCIPR
jgi:hypothetical protein